MNRHHFREEYRHWYEAQPRGRFERVTGRIVAMAPERGAHDAIAVPHPVIVVDVLSPGTASTDTGAKLADHFDMPSVARYLIVHPTRRSVVHHRRAGGNIETRIVASGEIAMDPPGIVITVEEFYRDAPN